MDDLVQDVWIAVWQALPRMKDRANLRSYIARITQNICVTHIRRAIVRRAEPLSVAIAGAGAPADEAVAHAGQLEGLIEAVRCLPVNLKAVATLYLEEMPIGEIALALGISEGNASVRLHRAKAAIRVSLGRLRSE